MPYPELATTLATTDDDLLLAAEAAARSHCGWHIAPVRDASVVLPFHQDHVRGLRAGHRHSLVLPTLHLLEVSSVIDNYGYVLPPECYTFEPAGILHINMYPWQGSHWTITRDLPLDRTIWLTITFRHGYPTTPPDVAAAVRTLALLAKNNPGLVMSRQIGPFAETFARDAESPVRATLASLDLYKLPPRA